MKIGPRFLAFYASLLVFLAVSCTSHQRPVAQSDASARAGTVNVPAGTPVDVEGASLEQARTQVMNAMGPGPIVIHAVAFAETDPISSLHGSFAEADPTQSQPGIEINELNSEEARTYPDTPLRKDATLKGMRSAEAVAAMPGPSITFEGNSSANNTAVFGGTVAPPDTNGAVGPNHYVQMTNLLTGIYDKATGALLPPGRFPLSPLFAKLGGVCATTNDGDPVVQYDKLADRWVLSQFGFTATNAPPYHQCIAVSKTSDPAGAYYAYDFVQPGNEFPDYPKLGTWPDAYYMTTNQFFMGGGFDGGGAFALDRAKMLVGDPTATEIYFNLCFTAGHCAVNHPEGIFGMLPSDFDGLTPPPAGAKNVFDVSPLRELRRRGGRGAALRAQRWQSLWNGRHLHGAGGQPGAPRGLRRARPGRPRRRPGTSSGREPGVSRLPLHAPAAVSEPRRIRDLGVEHHGQRRHAARAPRSTGPPRATSR